jgi:glycosyltransferase involved in cell wall biosynthesis
MQNVLFLTLKVFSATGGIEKVCRVAGKALYEESLEGNVSLRLMSLHDQQSDADENRYFPSEFFSGHGNHRFSFIRQALRAARKADVVLLSHINLLPVGWMIKKRSPKTSLFLFAHGIEIWGDLRAVTHSMLSSVDRFLCVSTFTKSTIREQHEIRAEKCGVVNNCLDPFLPMPGEKVKSPELLKRYGFAPADTVVFTLTRLSSKDRYKGYDRVLEALALIGGEDNKIRYLVGGSYDAIEKGAVDEAVNRLGLQDRVTIAGYIPDDELAEHFKMADVYVMPSTKEGFGIVFIEAMYYGLPVIAGNADGSVDALLNGRLGLLVNPENVEEIRKAIEKIIRDIKAYTPDSKLLMDHFSYDSYKRKLKENFGIGTEVALS